MSRYGPQYGPDVTFLGIDRCDLSEAATYADVGEQSFGSLIGHGQPMRRLISSGAVRGDRFLQIGLRGYWPPCGPARRDGGGDAYDPPRPLLEDHRRE